MRERGECGSQEEQAKGGPEWDGGRRGRDTRKKNQKTRERYLASHPQADEERMNGD